VHWIRRIACSLVLGACAAILTSCSYGNIAPVESATRAATPKPGPKPNAHVVHRGDTLYSIAWRYGLDYRRLAGWNAIREPYTIFPGQKLRLTQPPRTASTRSESIKKKRLPPPSSSQSKSARAPGTSSKSPSSAPANKSGSKKATSSGSRKKSASGTAKAGNAPVKRWRWPAKGKVVTSFSRSGGKGIDIAGKFGQVIVAASDGSVVYSGSGLIGYGQLIIVKHNKRYLSAYAHNNKILVKEGDTVKGGQRIAEMGRSGSNRAMLHFEIRRDGKPTNPVRYLPK
jgi:lipoprotein NlpD